MMRNPTVEDLKNSGKYNLVASVEQGRIREFVVEQAMADKKIIPIYMIYQTLLLFSGLFFLTRALVLAFRGEWSYFLISAGAVVFSLTILVAIHELLHAFALVLTGARRIRFGAVPGRFVFFAVADQHVMGKRTFILVALTPLICIQVATAIGIGFWFHVPFVYFFLILMSMHSLFCAGDIALITLFYRFPGKKVFTFDNFSEKTSYFFLQAGTNDRQ
jgi:hypothetical protein